ncbi:addiction module antidote protein [Bartonella doshiae]|uniref:addiction module antidote protein n=1 Tax=Bartonella doshiae TaxID=33044 RepID=UPI000944CA83|nr:addiction module antidote protein [Bartonella doshiae]
MEIAKLNARKYCKISDEEVQTLLQDALKTKSSHSLANALGIIAKSKGMTKVAKNTGLSREALYRSLSNKGDPRLSTFFSVLNALGLQINLIPVQKNPYNE